MDVSSLAQQSGYLDIACKTIQEQLDNLPGDARAQVGFIAYNSAVHFYNMADGFNQPHEITVLEVDGELGEMRMRELIINLIRFQTSFCHVQTTCW